MSIIIYFFIAAILVFIGFYTYGFLKQKSILKKGRQIEARVISCEEQLIIEKDGNKFLFYLVTVDFYGLNGETIVKTIKSKKKYTAGEVIISRYIDKKDLLWIDMNDTIQNKNSKKLLMLIGFLAVFLIAVISLYYFTIYSDKPDPKHLNIIIGYFISIVFVGIGVYGIRKKLKLNKSFCDMQVIDGTQVDYYVVRGRDSGDPSVYYPIYEFEFMGKLQEYQSNVGGSSEKYRVVGRKVHILINKETGKIICKEDAQSSSSWYILLGTVGIVVFGLLLATTSGLI